LGGPAKWDSPNLFGKNNFYSPLRRFYSGEATSFFSAIFSLNFWPCVIQKFDAVRGRA
jgi:hypothetical protein